MEKFELLCRGQRQDNGEWIEGMYMEQYHSHKHGGRIDAIFWSDSEKTHRAPVDSETVGLWTGMEDIKGRKVFAGHRVRSVHCGGVEFTVFFGTHEAWCLLDRAWMPTVGFYCQSDDGGKYPTGDLSSWAEIVEE